MNKDAFLQFIADSRDCEQSQLDKAINIGLFRARGKVDTKKILQLAAACVFTFVMCLTVNVRPLKAATDEYYRNRYKAMPGSSEVLVGYIDDIVELFDNIRVHWIRGF